jgi:hypothetical protein
MRGWLRAVAISTVALGLLTPAVSAKFRSIGTVQSNVYTDGSRYVAYQADGVTTVRDTSNRTSRTFSPRCVQYPGYTAGPNLPHLEGIGGGYVLWACFRPSYQPHALIGDIRTGAVIDAPDPDGYGGSLGSGLQAIGSSWIRAETGEYHAHGSAFLNWHTGAFSQAAPTNAVPDLDAPSLWTPLCAPLVRRPNDPSGFDTGPAYPDFQYRPPFGVQQSNGDRGALLLHRCGQRRATVLDRCRDECGSEQLGSGSLTWSSGPAAVGLYLLHTRGRHRHKLTPPDNPVAYVAHTRRQIFVTVGDATSSTHAYVTSVPK